MVFKIENRFKTLIVPLLLLIILSCAKTVDETPNNPVTTPPFEKYCGVSFVGPVNEIEASDFDPVVDANSNYVCLMPFSFGEFDSPDLQWDINWQWWGEKSDGVIGCTKFAREKGLKVFLKPHIWFFHGAYTGDFELSSEADWQEWEKNYMDYILDFALLADSLDIEMYSIGVELKNFVQQRPEFWKMLADTVNTVYHGDITYSANWDNYNNIPFWDKMDYMGINSYFPISDKKTPTLEELLTGWEEHYLAINEFQAEYDIPVIFTEYGYKSIDYLAKEPWNPDNGGGVNLEAQKTAYEAIYQKFWNEEWFAGGFIWKWYDYHESAGGTDNKNYTPQNKPAEDAIRAAYEK
ncbi:MAG: glycoside hydrolase [Bacteroidetes bacterium]|nr:MAG: glycoside hydrolase [Bacteroidota bacterium]